MTTVQHICLSFHSLWHARSTTWYQAHYMSTCTCPLLCICLACCQDLKTVIRSEIEPTLTIIIKISVHSNEKGGIVNKQSLTSESRPQETTVYGGERNVSAWRKPNESRLPVLRHQINFTLPHLPATVMSLIHPFRCSHGNSAAWSCSFFYICLSLLLSMALPLSRPQCSRPTYSIWGVQLHPQPHNHPAPSSSLSQCEAGEKNK